MLNENTLNLINTIEDRRAEESNEQLEYQKITDEENIIDSPKIGPQIQDEVEIKENMEEEVPNADEITEIQKAKDIRAKKRKLNSGNVIGKCIIIQMNRRLYIIED